MTKRIVLEDDEDGVTVPTSYDLYELHDAMLGIVNALRASAQQRGTKGAWEAVTSMQSALYSIHGAAGWLAQDEGRLN